MSQKSATMAATPKRSMVQDLAYHIRTLFLFTVSEHKTIVYPWTAFGMFGALSGPVLTTNSSPDLASIVARFPHTLAWMWLVILVFTISNQRLEESVVEDTINKPWRPMPSKRLTVPQARQLLLFTLPCVYLACRALGAGNEALMGMVLTWMYNDLKGSDENYIVRNLVNALGLTTWSTGATQVAAGAGGHKISTTGYWWLGVVCLMIFTTLQIQDFRDQAGDRVKGRRTAQIAFGDIPMRFLTAAVILLWSLMSPAWWALEIVHYLLPILTGGLTAVRLLILRNKEADERTWKLWALWVSSLFLLPLCKNPTVVTHAFAA